MSTYDKASLVLIPSGTKEGVVFSQKPTNGDGDFTFSRSTAATRVNADGLIEKETQNLLTYSNTFDVSWSNSGDSIVSNQSGYDGSNDAWLFTTSASSQYLEKSQGVSGVQTFSVYAKSGTTDGIVIRFIGGANPYVFWNLSDGSYAGSGAGASIVARESVSVGNGWYRVSITMADPSTSVRIYCGDSSGAFASGNIYIQDAQLEEGLVARDYIETTTTAVYGGITDNVPRLDYTDSSCPSLLLEPQRTNLVTYSEDFSNAAWVKTNVTITPNQGISPDGSNNAFKYFGASANQDLRINVNVSSNYTYSFYVKAINSPYIRLRSTDGSCWFNMTTNEVATNTFASAEIKSVGNDWYRLSVTSSSFTVNNNFYVHPHATDNTTSELSGGEFLLWGAQVEEGIYATSYIPTYGTSVTFASDACSKTGISDLIGQTEGTLFLDVENVVTKSFLMSFNESTTASVSIIKNSSNQIRCQVWGSSLVTILSGAVGSERLKIGFAYKSGNIAVYINGTQVGISSDAFTFNATMDRLLFPNRGTYYEVSETAKVNQALLFKTRLSNEELEALTTL